MRYLFFLTLLLAACSVPDKKTERQLVLLPLADTGSVTYDEKEIPYLCNFPVYIGAFPDTIDLQKAIVQDSSWKTWNDNGDSTLMLLPKLRGVENHIYGVETGSRRTDHKDSFAVFIDTVHRCQYKNALWLLEQRTWKKYQCYPVAITNLGKDTFFFYDLPLAIEVKTPSGYWDKRSARRTPVDHTGDPYYYAAPGETIVTFVPVYGGPTPALFRLNFHGEFYSREYGGNINPWQRK